MRVYLDNNLFAYLLALPDEKKRLNLFVGREARAVRELHAREDVELLCSDESLAEMEKTPNEAKRQQLQSLYSAIKADRAVIRNAGVTWDDDVTRLDSPDALWDHPHTDMDRQHISSFLQKKGIKVDEFDVRYLANARLEENQIDVFLTADKRTIWNFRHELRKEFGIRVALASELLAELENQK